MNKKTIIREFFNDYIQNIMIQEDVVNYDYIQWLEDFLQDREYFCDELQKNDDNLLSIFDLDNMTKLGFLYNAINNYAGNIGISPYFFDNGSYFLIKYNNIGYRVINYDGVVNYCQKIQINNYEYFIDVVEIINEKSQNNHKIN